jgi:hypothetical protein
MKEKKYPPVPYIKPTRYKHDSGFRCFEVGYILKMSDDNKVIKKKVLGCNSDHIHQDYIQVLIDRNPVYALNMDLTMDGYIRFFSHGHQLEWNFPMGLSSMGLKAKLIKK